MLAALACCYIGGVDANMEHPKDTRTEAQKEGLRCLISDLKVKYGSLTVHGHNEFGNKACPSFDVKNEYGE